MIPPKRGRPAALSSSEREARILDSLEHIIVHDGLGTASMNAIAAAAGMSKRTLYTVFENRHALFAALMRRTRANYVRPLDPAERALPLERRLQLLFSLPESADELARQSIAFRALVAGAGGDPELARVVMREGLQAARQIVRTELEIASDRGEIRLADAGLAARMLLDMVYEPPFERMADPDYRVPSLDALRKRARFAIRTFLYGVGG